MSKPAARITDMHTCPMVTPGTPPVPHVGGPILPPGKPTVLIGNLPAAVMGDKCVCVGPPDTIIIGAFTVLIGGKPAARMGDNTMHGGVIVAGCPTVLIGSGPGGAAMSGAGGTGGAAISGGGGGSKPPFPNGPLSEKEAQELFDKMASQEDIAFGYPIDGCYSRAHIMSQRMKDLGVTPKGKAWTFAEQNGPPLKAKTNNDPRGYVEWGYHVAPVIQVKNDKGEIEDRIIDPSLFDKPVSPEQWKSVQMEDGGNPILIQTKEGDPPIPRNGGSGYWPGTDPQEGLDKHAEKTMEKYKILEKKSKGSYNP